MSVQALRVALCQAAPVQANIRANTQLAKRYLSKLAGTVDFVAVPELFMTGYDIGKSKVRAVSQQRHQ